MKRIQSLQIAVALCTMSCSGSKGQTGRLTSSQGDIDVFPPAAGIRLNEHQEWRVALKSSACASSQKPARDLAITFEAEMPEHGHGLPSAVKVRPIGDSTYTVNGVRFNMPGKWIVEVVANRDPDCELRWRQELNL